MSCTAPVAPRNQLSNIIYHAQTVWLFTRSDLKTIVFPSTLFAFTFALVERKNDTQLPHFEGTFSGAFLLRLVWTLFWTWINLLPFAINNQQQSGSVGEDSENKPWRSLPAKRLTSAHAASLMKFCYVLAFVTSVSLGYGVFQCVSLIGLGFWYNDLGGKDKNIVIRNLINGAGYTCFLWGALEIQTRTPAVLLQPQTRLWLLILCAVICTSVHAQDMPDQAGDRRRCRQTMTLVLGDGFTRWLLAIAISWWSFACPTFWKLNWCGFAVPVLLGSLTSSRFLLLRTVDADRVTFKVYNIWIMALFTLPLLQPQSL